MVKFYFKLPIKRKI